MVGRVVGGHLGPGLIVMAWLTLCGRGGYIGWWGGPFFRGEWCFCQRRVAMRTACVIGLMTTLCLVSAAAALAAETASAEMKLVASEAVRKLGGYRPQRLQLSSEKPGELKKAPDLALPLYGTLHFGGGAYLVVVDEPEGKDARLYVDTNGNGDLTDDGTVSWTKRSYSAAGGKQLMQYMGAFKLPLGVGEGKTEVSVSAYRFDKGDPQRAALKNTLLYYADYAYEGRVILNDVSYKAMLADDYATGDFRGGKPANLAAGSGIRLLIDVNGDGKFDGRSETFDVKKPFNIKGTTWELADVTAGGSFRIVKSSRTVAEIEPPPNHSVGKTITAFKATTMEGREVNFPADYKGKIVMLDFWATWCGPCMAEVPGLVKAYNEYHGRGVEILGISLDQANAAEKVKSVAAEKGMTWAQVYDGKFWQAEIARKYGINSIPAAFLVDGDTGEILAVGNSLRGAALAETFKAALAKRGGGEKQ